jgi:hypothetical protein
VWTGWHKVTFRRRVLSPSSGLKLQLFYQPVHTAVKPKRTSAQVMLTQCSTVLLERLTVAQLFMQFFVFFFRTLSVSTVPTRAGNCSLTSARYSSPHPVYLRPTLDCLSAYALLSQAVCFFFLFYKINLSFPCTLHVPPSSSFFIPSR